MMKRITYLLVAVMLGGCLGQNALFNRVQDWNATATEEKFVNQGISFVFWWLPVYSLTMLGDIVIFNSVEFWTGENPITGAPAKVTQGSRVIEDGLGNRAELAFQEDGSVKVTEYRDGKVHQYRLVRDQGVVTMEGESPSLAMQ